MLHKDHPELLRSRATLGGIYILFYDFTSASKILSKTLEKQKIILGDFYPDVASTLTVFSRLYRRNGKYDKAIEHRHGAARIRAKIFGPEHNYTGDDFWEIAQLLKLKGNSHQEAAKFAKQYFEMWQKVLRVKYNHSPASTLGLIDFLEKRLGQTHLSTRVAIKEFSILHDASGDFETARNLYERMLRSYDEMGEVRCFMAITINSYGKMMYELGNIKTAELCFRRALKICEQTITPIHHDRMDSVYNLARVLTARKEFDEAMILLERAHMACEENYPTDHPALAECMYNMAECYIAKGNPQEAKGLLYKTIKIYTKYLGKSHPDVCKAKDLLKNTL